MDKQTLLKLFSYHYWANRRLWRAVMMLSEQQFTEGRSSIRAQIVGMVANENLWVNYLWHGEVEYLHERQLPTRANIRQEWDALEAEMLDFIGELSTADLETLVKPAFLDTGVRLSVSEILVHVIAHGVEGRAQLCQRLQQMGALPPAHDYYGLAHAISPRLSQMQPHTLESYHRVFMV